MTTEELAAYLRVTPDTARRYMGRVIPAAFVGGRWTAAKADVDRYLQSKTVTGRATRRRGRASSIT